MKRVTLFTVIVLVALFAACAVPTAQVTEQKVEVVVTATPEPPPTPAEGGTLIIGKAQEAVGLDPHKVTAASSFQVTAQVYDQLIELDEEYSPQPELAESWENPDDTTFIFHLRHGVKFHNGREMMAADVKYSFERIIDPDTASPWASQLASIDSIETPDDYTVVANLSEPYGAFMPTIASTWAAIVPQEAVDEFGDLQSEMVGTGPFMLEEYVPDTETVLTSFEDYWGGAPLLDGVTYRILPDEAARLAALRTGEIHMTPISDPTAVGLAARSEGVNVVSQPTTDYYLWGFNTEREPLNDVRVRQALSLAVDRQAMLDAVLFGEGLASGPIVPTLGAWSVPIEELPYYKVDIERAKELLADAGYAEGFDISITASPAYPQFISIALVLQQQLEAINVNATLDQVEWGTFINKWIERDFDTFVSYNGSGNDPDRALYPALVTDGSVNAFQFSDSEVDRLLTEGRTTVDRQARMEIYAEAQKVIAEQAPLLFLFTRTEYVGLRDSVHDFELSPVETYRSLKRVWME
jgi:peptide/nickel transport system substrate-binding protein